MMVQQLNPPSIKVKAHRAVDHSALQAKLTVAEIMTPRVNFICATASETVASAFADVDPIFDALPVVDCADKTDPQAEIIGIIDRRWVKRPNVTMVASEMTEWNGEAIRADLPLLEFARTIRGDLMQFVSGGHKQGVDGLVTIFDIQRLPVRIALFAALTDLEEDMSALIDQVSTPSEWLDLIPGDHRDLKAEIEKGLKRAQRRDDLGSPILALGFGCKAAIFNGLTKQGRVSGFRDSVPHGIVRLRNDIAHGMPLSDIFSIASVVSEAVSIHAKIKRVLT